MHFYLELPLQWGGGSVNIVTGSYKGTDTTMQTINLDTKPKCVIISSVDIVVVAGTQQ